MSWSFCNSYNMPCGPIKHYFQCKGRGLDRSEIRGWHTVLAAAVVVAVTVAAEVVVMVVVVVVEVVAVGSMRLRLRLHGTT